ncbi:DUF1543 domain-containing protein [Idiomarina xiamenensis]|uniref:DUF1543 domain-containing protein n=1 Tax=Idiomarina xiamenensis 10-D-4 TaxID=740709 RepID=K2KAA7_9GAMM|nr:DUF1543 domain-containing protein [Idiomarina xiamenensis]EKE84728.1 hypothetical protein A10D4_03920 [Idiomarina xiamenensis 10-D-4]
MAEQQPRVNAPHLFAVLLGGKAQGCRLECHDMVFVIGDNIEQIIPQLPALWFGQRQGLHIDGWQQLDQIDGYRIQCLPADSHAAASAVYNTTNKLWFVHLGGYQAGTLAEQHDNCFVVANDSRAAKQLALARSNACQLQPHRDAQFAIDEVLPLDLINPWRIVVETDSSARSNDIVTTYLPI